MDEKDNLKRVDSDIEPASSSTFARSPKDHQDAELPVHAANTDFLSLGCTSFNAGGLRNALYRVGKNALLTIVGTIALMAAITAFFAFLWFTDEHNTAWYSIMVRGWATRAVSIPSLFLRAAVDLQSKFMYMLAGS